VCERISQQYEDVKVYPKLSSPVVVVLLCLQAVHSRGQHSISFTLSRNQTVVVEYCHDNDTDMFQVNTTAMFFFFFSAKHKNNACLLI
jgi:hypothetical protein